MRGDDMNEKKESIKAQIIKNIESIVDEISKGNDIELKRAVGSGLKVMVVKKRTILNTAE
jgi:hypothetical protein